MMLPCARVRNLVLKIFIAHPFLQKIFDLKIYNMKICNIKIFSNLWYLLEYFY